MCNQNTILQDYELEAVIKRIKTENYREYGYVLRETQEDFEVKKNQNPQFIAPILAEVPELSSTDLAKANIILIEAVGATGKTELTRNLSYRLKCPVLDLGKTKVVAGNSLTGLLTKRMQRKDSSIYMDDITAGQATIIIDALDEGYMKTNNQGYLDFLDDVLSLEPQKECPIVMLGRYNAVELAAAFLLDNGADFVTLQIEPFTHAQAKEFIDKAINTNSRLKYESVYEETRDYIIETINGFFKNQASIKNNMSQRFIGYAPVLQSIAAFFDENTNYRVVLDDLRKNNYKSVKLIIDIIERILKRDREQKVIPFVTETLLEGRSERFKKEVMDVIYDFDEQCARIVYDIMHIPFPELSIKDVSFINAYNEHIVDWIHEHPFIGKNKLANIVFESYILARMINNVKYRDVAYRYMRENGTSYMFAYIYQTLYGFDEIDKRTLPYLYESLRELNNKQAYYSFEMNCIYINPQSGEVGCSFEFYGSNKTIETYKGSVVYFSGDSIDLGSHLEYITISTPLDFRLSAMKVEATAPSYINCRNLIVESEELILHTSATVHPLCGDSMFTFECENVNVSPNYNQFLQISCVGNGGNSLKVICEHKPEYPVLDYWESPKAKLPTLSDEMFRRYKKLRSIILEFRSHSKSELAKHHERIDFVLGSNAVGNAIIKALLSRKIMYQKSHLYILDNDVMDTELGLSYDGIRNFNLTDKVKLFLNDIDITY